MMNSPGLRSFLSKRESGHSGARAFCAPACAGENGDIFGVMQS